MLYIPLVVERLGEIDIESSVLLTVAVVNLILAGNMISYPLRGLWVMYVWDDIELWSLASFCCWLV